ncbi:hypothetical protein C0V77_10025 [Emticicia sp. TH156]|nr:hypothetical protein C0V77_10025 [Emticicia sp. TH156]
MLMTRYFLNRCVITLIVLLGTVFHASAQTAEEYLKAGEKKFANKAYKEALIDFDKAILLNPKSIEAYNAKGSCLYELKQFKKAAEAYGYVIKFDSTNADAYNKRGVCYVYGPFRLREAIKDYTKAINLNPDNIKPYYNRGFLRNWGRGSACAIGDFTAILMIDSTNSNIWINRGNSFKKDKQFTAAILDYTKAISKDAPDKLMAYFNRGICYEAIGKNDDAAQDFNTVLRLDPSKPDNTAYLKQPMQLKHLHRKAKKIIKKAFPSNKQWQLKV